jgi:cytoskeleton protein RodZ
VQDSLGMRVGKLTPMQVQHLIEIGAFLQQVREDQGLSLEQITATTYVPLRMLRAIELGQIEVLPEAVFIQGFIRRYAEAMGLEGIAVAKQFPLSPDSKPLPPRSSAATGEPSGAEDGAFGASTEPEQSESPPVRANQNASLIARRMARRSQSSSSLPWLLGAGAAVVVVGLALTFGNFSQSTSEPTSETADAPAASTEPSEAIAPEAEPTDTLPAVPNNSSVESTPTEGLTVTLNIREASWMSVTVDGEVEFEGIAAPGTEQQWQGDQEVTIVAGNAGGVMLSYNGSDAQLMGESGEVQEITYTVENSQSAASE